MANLKTTLVKIKSLDLGESSFKKLCKAIGSDDGETEVYLLQILDSNGPKFAYSSLRCWDYKDYCLLSASVAQSVAHLNEDPQVQKCIDSIKLWHGGQITEDELADAMATSFAAAWDESNPTFSSVLMAASRAALRDSLGSALWAAWWVAESFAGRDSDRVAAWLNNEKLMREFCE